MKNLALLCNLHADGPVTAGALRRDGCEGLSTLLEYEVRDLARLLDWDDARAERFLREGAELQERLDQGLLASEESYFEEEEVLEGDDEEDAVDWDEEEREDTSVQTILDTWRDLDEETPPPPPGEGFVLPRPEPGSETPLRALAVAGLSPDVAEQLSALGISTAESLLDRAPLELSEALDLGLTRVLRLQFLVRRSLRRGFEPDGAPTGA